LEISRERETKHNEMAIRSGNLLTLQRQRKISKGREDRKKSHLHPNVGITTSAIVISTQEPRDQESCQESIH